MAVLNLLLPHFASIIVVWGATGYLVKQIHIYIYVMYTCRYIYIITTLNQVAAVQASDAALLGDGASKSARGVVNPCGSGDNCVANKDRQNSTSDPAKLLHQQGEVHYSELLAVLSLRFFLFSVPFLLVFLKL